MVEQTVAAETTTASQLTGSWLRTARLAWVLLALLMAAMLLTALPAYGQTMRGELAHISPQNQDNMTAVFVVLAGIASLTTALLCFGLALLFFRQRFTEPVAAGLSFYLLLYAVIMAGPLELWGAYWLGDASLALRLQSGLIAVPTIALLVLFPNGRFVPKWSRWLVPVTIPLSVVLLLLPTNDPTLFTGSLSGLITALTAGLIGLFAVAFYAQYVRYRQVSTAVERQQTKWVVYGLALWLGYMLLSSIPYYYLESLPPDAPVPWWASISVLGWFLSLSIIPICLAVAVTRYRLWEIDILINRTLVYGVLTAVTVGLYALVVGGLATIFQAQTNWLIALVATGLVAVLFQPLRDRLQSRVNRLLYGERDRPLEVLAQLGQRLEDALPPEQVLPTLVETIARTLKLPYVAITGQLGAPLASFGKAAANAQPFALIYQGATIGQLLAAPRSADETFTAAETRLLRNIARQAGTAVHAQQLTADLQQARRQIVSSREEERRRLRRDLHDGLGPQLATLAIKASTAQNLLHTKPDAAAQLLAEVKAESQSAVREIRRVVDDLRPSVLDQLGLASAVQEFAAKNGVGGTRFLIQMPDEMPPLPAAVEVAAYRIVTEAITNVLRHARARTCTVRLEVGSRLHLLIEDDGQGLPDAYEPGVGLDSMHERAAELGGILEIQSQPGRGTRLLVELPVGESA